MTPFIRRRASVAGIACAALASLLLPAGLHADAAQAVPAPSGPPKRLVVQVNRSMVLAVPYDITLYSFTDPLVADGLTVGARELLINGLKPGTISLFVFGSTARDHYELVVDENRPTLQQRLQALFPGEDIQVTTVGAALVLSGTVSTSVVIERAAEIAKASGAGNVINLLQPRDSAPATPALQQQIKLLFPDEDIQVTSSGKAMILSGHVSTDGVLGHVMDIATGNDPDKKVINLLKVTSVAASQQVMLQVRFAEVSHRALTELGVSLAGGSNKIDARSTTQQFPAPNINPSSPGLSGNPTSSSATQKDALAFNDLLNLFFFSRDQNIAAVIKALQQKGSFQSLAEPNLIAYNDKEASFLAGGQIPVPIVSPTGGVSFDYKPFGVSLKFKPTILGDMIHLKVRPEVSRLDFPNGVIYQGVPIPALTTRWAETEVELHDGQSFAVAGLLDNSGQEDKRAVPILSKIPILGALFRSKSKGEDRMELLVLITPHLVQPLNPDQVPALPKIIKKESRRP